MKISQILIVLFFLALVSNCRTAKNTTTGLTGIHHPDFLTFSTLRTGNAPGYIYRKKKRQSIDKGDFVGELTALRPKVTFETFPNKRFTTTSSGVLKLLGIPNTTLQGTYGSNATIQLSFGEGIREQVPVPDIEFELRRQSFNTKKQYSYFVVTETIAFDSIALMVSGGRKFESENKALMKELELNGTLKYSYNDTLILAQKFKTPRRLFYKTKSFNEDGIQIGEAMRFKFTDSDVPVPEND
jgi:hypothetical protein